MSVRLNGPVIHLEGPCGVEEAETLAALLDEPGAWQVDLSEAAHLHGAVIQALLVFRPTLRGTSPADPFTKDFLQPALAMMLEDR